MAYRLLVPLDGSMLAHAALPWADALASALRAEVQLLCALPPDPGLGATAEPPAEPVLGPVRTGPPPPDLSLLVARAHADAASDLVAASRQFRPGTSIVTVVDHGAAEDVIAARAHAQPDVVIVMATHGRGGRAPIGSVTASVIRRARVPVVTVRPHLTATPQAPRRVLVPLDTSELAEAVLEPVIPLARALEASLVLCSVLEPARPASWPAGAAIPLDQVPDRPPARLMDYLERTAANLRSCGLTVGTITGHGERAAAIVQAAHQADCGLIAMSTHGRHGLGRLAFGSVAEAVIQQAGLPVLAIHPPAPAARIETTEDTRDATPIT